MDERKDQEDGKFETFEIIDLDLEKHNVEIPKFEEKEVRKVKGLKQYHCLFIDDISAMKSEVFFRATTCVCTKCSIGRYRECTKSEIYGKWHIANILKGKKQDLNEDKIETDVEYDYEEYEEDIETEQHCHNNYEEIVIKFND